MSLFSIDDYRRENLKANKSSNPRRSKYHGGIRTSKQTRLPTQHKTHNHKCSQCIRTDAKQYSISEKDTRWLCMVCVNQYNQQFNKEKPNFVKASLLRR